MRDRILDIYHKLKCVFVCPHEINVKKAIKKIELLQADKHQLEIILNDTDNQLQKCREEIIK